jgi:hypothetical protein
LLSGLPSWQPPPLASALVVVLPWAALPWKVLVLSVKRHLSFHPLVQLRRLQPLLLRQVKVMRWVPPLDLLVLLEVCQVLVVSVQRPMLVVALLPVRMATLEVLQVSFGKFQDLIMNQDSTHYLFS